ncbi:uncharacterized protein LOC105770207 [Gossypium raimondii]|uniref:Remorin C-terminal domain-containing protein n=1 Tax=Gossypium raimondii TaxID=29730 RepID=A0A0D2TQM9_GOSRA|nr:uncharacterized protein LOC105770207 [Gossypium raimondii]KJB57201.1 hypothetical protein B456_009G152800 [Gossypium raimondii]
MEYERMDKPQSGISPSKLRMKLMGPHHHRKKDGSNSNSSRTSPSRIEDAEFVNSLLTSNNEDFDEEVPSLDVAPVKISNEMVSGSTLNDQISGQAKEMVLQESIEMSRAKSQQFPQSDNGNSSAVHPMRTLEDENLDYDSNASSSSFEFHKGERGAVHNCLTRSYSRPVSSKWNDAEKWIMNRQNVQATYAKKNAFHNQVSRYPISHMVRVAPESANYDQRTTVNGVSDTKRVDFYQHAVQMPFEKFSFVPSGAHHFSAESYGGNLLFDQCPQSKDLREVAERDLCCTKSSEEDTTVFPAVRSVCMRDMGTEMTPVASQEPSRTATPVGATTPLRSPTSSIPSTPRGGALSMPLDYNIDDESQHCPESGKKELSEREAKLKTRKEIVALGVQLGKMNIAAWASKDEKEANASSGDTTRMEELERIDYEKRAAAWQEAEKSKHTARYKREEIKIQAWESQQRAKLEAEMRRIEAKVEQMRGQAQAKMVKKIAMSRQRSEEKRAAAEARKNRDAERTSAKAEYIRQTGRMPSSPYMCCGWPS